MEWGLVAPFEQAGPPAQVDGFSAAPVRPGKPVRWNPERSALLNAKKCGRRPRRWYTSNPPAARTSYAIRDRRADWSPRPR